MRNAIRSMSAGELPGPDLRSLCRTLAAASLLSLGSTAAAENRVLQLTNGGDAVIVPHHPSQNPGSAITIEYWIKWSGAGPNASDVRYGRPVAKRSPSGAAYSFTWFGLSNLAIELGLVTTQHPGITLSTEWEHHATTWSAQSREVRFYRNGVMVFSAVVSPTSLASSSDQLRFGNTGSGFESATQFKGKLDDIRIWRVERTAAQIAQYMCVSIGASQAPQHAGLIGSWTFEGDASDATGVNHGTLTGGAAIVADPACVGACVGDVTGNRIVDGVDLAAVLGAWGANGQGQYDCDVDDDGIVGGTDLAFVLGAWGTCP